MPTGSSAALVSLNQSRLAIASATSVPLASSESLATTEASVGSSSSVVHKPFEPPGLGKPSRVTPVDLDEADGNDLVSGGGHLSTTDSLSINQDQSSVEVLSVIRFNKSASSVVGDGGSIGGRPDTGATSKISCSSNLSVSERARSSSSETAATSNSTKPMHSLLQHRSDKDSIQAKTVPFSPCPACEANASSHKHPERNHTATIFNTIKRRRA